jgi:thioredoxin-related protein
MKKIAFVFFLCIVTFTLTSCKSLEYSDMDEIIYSSMLSQEESKYIIIIYKNKCEYCDDALPTVSDYVKKSRKDSSLPHLYVVNASKTRLNQGLSVENDTDYENFVGTMDYTAIHINATPALLVVENKKVTKLISSKTTERPKTEIINYLKQIR